VIPISIKFQGRVLPVVVPGQVISPSVVRSGGTSAKAWRAVSRDSWEAAGDHWHDKILPKHFKPGAAREYRYKRRTAAHQAKKQRMFGHRRPLVFRGDLERQVLRLRDVRGVADNSKRRGAVKIKLSGPAQFRPFRTLKDLNKPDLASEVQRVSDRDGHELAKVMDRELTKRLGG